MVSALFPAKDAPSSYTKNAPTIHVRPRQVDTLTVFIPPFCPRLNELTAKRRGSSLRDITPEGAIPPDSAAIKKDSDALAMLKKVEDILLPHDVSGSPEKGWTTTFYLQRYFDTFQTRACHSKPMPCGPTGNRCIDEETAEKIKYLSEWQIWYEYLSARARSPEEAKLRFGPLMRDVVTSMQSPAIEGPADHVQPKPHDPLTHSTHSDQPSLRRRDQSNKLKRVFLYSAHDTTLSGLLGIFLELGERWPPYASILAVEVWNVPTNSPESGSAAKLDRWVRVMYNDRVLKSWCDNKDGFCTMDHFLRFLDPVLPKNFARECAMK
ncbi:histidine phosphatase superfamily [Cladochytrium replicatum]|nr:histidine phosphatase superfamily [Cladochytrium replicatum]